MKVNVLVTATGGTVGQGIIKSLKLSRLDFKIIACDAQPYAAGLYRVNKSYIVPTADSADFIDKVITICNKENIHAILIGTIYELEAFAKHKKIIEKEGNTHVIVSDLGTIRVANDKWETYKFLIKHDLPAPPTALSNDSDALRKEYGFPLIIKPRFGTASKNVYIVTNEEELNKYLSIVPNAIVQKYVPGEEFTSTTVVFNKKCYGIISMKREMKYPGITTKALIDDFSKYNHVIKKVAEVLNPFGPCNFQWKLEEDKPMIFEINCRFSGTTPFCAMVGFNTVEMVIRHVVLGEEIKPLEKFRKGIILRYFNEVFIPTTVFEILSIQGFIDNPKSKVNIF